MKAPGSTARLAAVVKATGQPEAVTLWVSPQRDKDFQAAVKENRVLTINQETTGTKKDFGVVGFHKQRNAGYWIFPKPLDQFEGKRIVGIDYGVLKMPEPKGSKDGEQEAAKSKPLRRAAVSRPVVLHRFQVTVRCVASVDVAAEVEAVNNREAGEKALARVSAEKVNFAEGSQSRKVVRMEKLAG